VIYIDDCSTDNTKKIVEAYVQSKGLENKVTILHNSYRRGALANIYTVIQSIDEAKIVVICDGDDWLSNASVLDTLAEAYADKNVWLTYGNYESTIKENGSCCAPIEENVAAYRLFRYTPWVTAHLRTFYAKLFHQIKRKDLLWNGQFYPMAGDLAIMFPMLEMASNGHIKFIDKILYIYNIDNPLSDVRVQPELQLELDKHIRFRPPYEPLKELL
jgi:glycosyltransferase involved in cell wall biosynthesis